MSSPATAGRPETRAAILEAARAVIERDGYHTAALEDVAREAGVSRQAVYLHFGSKAKLFTALIQHVNDTERMGERLEHVADAPTGVEAMERWVRLNAEVVPRILDVVIQLDVARHSEPAAEAIWRTQAGDRRRWCHRIVSRMAREGGLAGGWSVKTAADLLWELTMPRAFEELIADGAWSPKRHADNVLTVLRRSLLRR